jgi:hypothetical protein
MRRDDGIAPALFTFIMPELKMSNAMLAQLSEPPSEAAQRKVQLSQKQKSKIRAEDEKLVEKLRELALPL